MDKKLLNNQQKNNKDETSENRKIVHSLMKKYGIKREIQQEKKPLAPRKELNGGYSLPDKDF